MVEDDKAEPMPGPERPVDADAASNDPAAATPIAQPGASLPVVGVGASAGGLEAFQHMVRALPTDTGMAFVLVQHLDPTHASRLTEILSRATAMPVHEVSDGMRVAPNHVFVIPPGTTMAIRRGMLGLSRRTASAGQHRPIDLFLQSLAEDLGPRAIGVILSGTATDGTSGLQAIKAEGGITFAQDDSAEHTSMPRSAIAGGWVDFVLPPDGIAMEIARIGRHPYVAPSSAARLAEPPGLETNISEVIEVLRHATGVDFGDYKRNTLNRRITRRTMLQKSDTVRDYVNYLRNNPAEVEALYQDILISVTSFFRDPDSFEVLKEKVFPRLMHERSRHDPVRVWVLGCSTGEEAYSLAISFAEYAELTGREVAIQIFATDLNGTHVEKARAGVYPKTIAQDVSPERLRRFFVEVDGFYRISKDIRDACVFARHNALTDPPFSRIDLITCRNLLIYLEPVLQQRMLPTLHYALRPNGFFWVGGSETIGAYRELFELVDPRHKIYAKKVSATHLGPTLPPEMGDRHTTTRARTVREPGPAHVDMHKEADRILLNRYAPPGVLVNADFEILQFRGDTGAYLAPAPGRASLSLLKMLRECLLVPVRAALYRAKKDATPVTEEGLRVKSNGGYRDVNVSVVPIKGASAQEGCYLVLFEETHAPEARPSSAAGSARGVGAEAELGPAPPGESSDSQVARLTQELSVTREYLQSVIEQQEAANEGLQSANEEVQSANEELQSINEELETSKEEIQSSNEELVTVNEELQNRNQELAQINNDLVNLLSSVQMAIVILGPDLRIRRLTPIAERLLNLIPADIGRPFGDLKLSLDIPDLEPLLLEVMETVSVREREVRDKHGRWHLLRLRPYRTLENKIDGVVLMLVDVDRLKHSEAEIRRLAELLEKTFEPILIWDTEGTIVYWNRGAEETYGYPRAQAVGSPHQKLLKIAPGELGFRAAIEQNGVWTGELRHTRRDGQVVVVESRMTLVRDHNGNRMVIETTRPITERKEKEVALRLRADELARADQAKNEFIAMLAHELRNPLAPLRNALEVLKVGHVDTPTSERMHDMMDRQVLRITRMVNDLLDVARITQGKVALQKETVELREVIGRAVESIQLHLEARKHDLRVELPSEPVYVEGDDVRLDQIFTNLLDNAAKFTPSGGHIEVHAQLVRRAASPTRDQIVVRIRDDGVGIEAAVLPHVFELFMQADHSLDRARGGLGIGLTLVKRLVELHGGSIDAHSAGLGQGSEFVVHLDTVEARAAQEQSAPDESAAGPSQRRILVVDDNVDSAQSLAALLELSGHLVKVAYDAQHALDTAAAFCPHTVLLDIGLPGMNGFEVAKRLRRLAPMRKAFIVAVSGYGQEEHRRAAQEAGFDAFVTKPVAYGQLTDLLSQGQHRDH